MAGDPLAFAAFTLFPLLVLGIGVVLSVAYASLLDDRRILLSTVLFLLMAFHQGTELWAFVGGTDPFENLLGEMLETAVNLLAVGAIGYVVWSLRTERQLRERLAIIQGTVLGEAEMDTAVGELGGETERARDRPIGPTWRWIPGLSRLIGFLYTTLPLGTTADLPAVLRTAVQNTRVTFPIAAFEVDEVEAATVFAEPTYLQEVLETIFERLVVYNDSSDPVVDIAVDRGPETVELSITDNGSGLPPEVADLLTGATGESPGTDDLELAYVHSYLEKWGGSVSVEDGTVRITLLTPSSVSNGGV